MKAILKLDGKEIEVTLLGTIEGVRYGARCQMPNGAIEMHVTANVRPA